MKNPFIFLPQNLLLPFYHIVSENTPIHIKQLYQAKKPDQFIKELDMFLRYFTPIELAEIQKEKKYSKASFHLSVDDGLQEVYTVIAPILLEKKIPATFFVNSAYIDNKDLMPRHKQSLIIETMFQQNISKLLDYTPAQILSNKNMPNELLEEMAKELSISFDEYLQEYKPYVSSSQIKELMQAGFTFGSHSYHHYPYASLSLKNQLLETQSCLSHLDEKFGLPIKAFAFPFTDNGVTTKFFSEMQNHWDFSFGISGINHDSLPKHFQRLDMDKSSNPYKYLFKKMSFYKLKKLMGMEINRF